MHFCIISDDYPSKSHASFVFVQQLCNVLADKGIHITVIAPQSITKILLGRKRLEPKYTIEFNDNKKKIEIYRPYFITLSNVSGFLKKVVGKNRELVINRVIIRMKSKPDIFYGHFWHNGFAVFQAAKRYDLPLFIASGESEIQLYKIFTLQKLKDFTKYVSGVICVSTKNKEESIKHGLTTNEKCIVIPNAVDRTKFYPQNKSELRKKYSFSNAVFIVAFIGGFIYRKGSKRIADAITSLNDKSIKSIFIGGGIKQPESLPDCDGIIFQGELAHDKIVDYLNCADVFVLPTLQEGSNNAIIEAMACGIPVISSNLSFNYDTLEPSFSILVDPLNIKEIADAIKYLKDNPEIRKTMGKKAFMASKNFDITDRANKIVSFIEQNKKK